MSVAYAGDMSLRLLLLASCALVAACDSPDSDPARIDVRLGRTAEAHGVRVTFEDVPTDSRCPVDVQCIQAGDAIAALALRAGAETGSVRLHTNTEPRSAEIAGRMITLVDLLPLPRSDRPTPPGDYVAQLLVEP